MTHFSRFATLWFSLVLALVACAADPDESDDEGQGGNTSGQDFLVFDCNYALSCDDGTSLTLPFQSCTTSATLDEVFLESDIQVVCDARCAEMGATSATACDLDCAETGQSCSCPEGAAECYP